MSLFDRLVARIVRRGELTVEHPDGSVKTFGTPDPAFGAARISIRNSAAERRMLRDPSLGLGEGIMEGDVRVENDDIMGLLTLLTRNIGESDPGERGRFMRALSLFAAKFREANSRLRARRNVAHHYDLSGRLYDLFLDTDRQYSCAYFTDPANDLDRAQEDKKAHIAAKLLLEPGQRVLDIGCGWGGLALYLHEKTGADVLGVTLSEEQLKVARERADAAGVAGHVRFELTDYRDVAETFDRVVSVGMFEHVGRPNYGTFFDCVRDRLTPDGVALIHTIGRRGGPGVTDSFTAKYIFPGGYIPALSEMIAPVEQSGLWTTDVEMLRLHYAYTLEHWYERTFAHRKQIVELYDERFWRMWLFYLAGSRNAFANGGLLVVQAQLARSRDAVPLTRDYIGDAEERLAQSDAAAARRERPALFAS